MQYAYYHFCLYRTKMWLAGKQQLLLLLLMLMLIVAAPVTSQDAMRLIEFNEVLNLFYYG